MWLHIAFSGGHPHMLFETEDAISVLFLRNPERNRLGKPRHPLPILLPLHTIDLRLVLLRENSIEADLLP